MQNLPIVQNTAVGCFFALYKNQTAINQSINGTTCPHVADPTLLDQLGNFLCPFKAVFVRSLIKCVPALKTSTSQTTAVDTDAESESVMCW